MQQDFKIKHEYTWNIALTTLWLILGYGAFWGVYYLFKGDIPAVGSIQLTQTLSLKLGFTISRLNDFLLMPVFAVLLNWAKKHFDEESDEVVPAVILGGAMVTGFLYLSNWLWISYGLGFATLPFLFVHGIVWMMAKDSRRPQNNVSYFAFALTAISLLGCLIVGAVGTLIILGIYRLQMSVADILYRTLGDRENLLVEVNQKWLAFSNRFLGIRKAAGSFFQERKKRAEEKKRIEEQEVHAREVAKRFGDEDGKMTWLKNKLRKIGCDVGADQVEAFMQRYEQLDGVMRRKLSPDEMTYGMFDNAISEMIAAGIANLEAVSMIFEYQGRDKMKAVEDQIRNAERGSPQLDTLHARLKLLEEQKQNAQRMLDQNAESLRLLDNLIEEMVAMVIDPTQRMGQMRDALERMKDTIGRVSGYATQAPTPTVAH